MLGRNSGRRERARVVRFVKNPNLSFLLGPSPRFKGEGKRDPPRSTAEIPMGGAKQFTAAVTEQGVP
jgi:hypothetical protein